MATDRVEKAPTVRSIVSVQSVDRSNVFACAWGAFILLDESDAWCVLVESGSVRSWPVPPEAAAGIKAFLEEGFRQLQDRGSEAGDAGVN